jgi:hypothetical protein
MHGMAFIIICCGNKFLVIFSAFGIVSSMIALFTLFIPRPQKYMVHCYYDFQTPKITHIKNLKGYLQSGIANRRVRVEAYA